MASIVAAGPPEVMEPEHSRAAEPAEVPMVAGPGRAGQVPPSAAPCRVRPASGKRRHTAAGQAGALGKGTRWPAYQPDRQGGSPRSLDWVGRTPVAQANSEVARRSARERPESFPPGSPAALRAASIPGWAAHLASADRCRWAGSHRAATHRPGRESDVPDSAQSEGRARDLKAVLGWPEQVSLARPSALPAPDRAVAPAPGVWPVRLAHAAAA